MLHGSPSYIRDSPGGRPRLRNLPRYALAPLPIFLLQPLLSTIIAGVSERHPGLFSRLGDNPGKRILIDPLNLPFALLLVPDPDRPSLKAVRRNAACGHDARIAGTFLTLLDLIDCQVDSDALFFNRDLLVEGDTETVVALRNALDDMDDSLAEDIAAHAGPFSRTTRAALSKLRKIRRTTEWAENQCTDPN